MISARLILLKISNKRKGGLPTKVLKLPMWGTSLPNHSWTPPMCLAVSSITKSKNIKPKSITVSIILNEILNASMNLYKLIDMKNSLSSKESVWIKWLQGSIGSL